jgi:hypothetical protein
MTIERPMFPPRAEADLPSATVISFPRSRSIARQYLSTAESEYAPRPRRYAKNPLRQHVTRLSMAIVEANKIDEFIDAEALGYIREGAESARILAVELGCLADRLEGWAMSNEISEEAKKALADVSRRKAIDRLQRDGCCSMDAVRRRVQAIAEERNLQPADIAKLMHKRIRTLDVMAFCEKHKVSADWLFCGDLRGLQRMTREAKATPREMPEAQRKEVIQLFSALPPRMQAVALGCMQTLLARGHLWSAGADRSESATGSGLHLMPQGSGTDNKVRASPVTRA